MTTTAALDRIIALHAAAPDRAVLVGIDGWVAAGKSTFAAALAGELQLRGIGAAVVAADGFLRSAAALRDAGLTARKGVPESFDRPALHAFLAAVKAGDAPDAPRYSHADYDVSTRATQSSAGAVVLFEGVNVLSPDLAPLFDLKIYLDLPEDEAKARFLKRFVATPFTPVRAAALAPWRPKDGDPARWGEAVWAGINAVNGREHISAGKARADLVIA